MKILVINAGSSSLKYQLIDMETEKLLAKGLVERIGDVKNSILTHKKDGNATEIKFPMENHGDAMKLVLKALVNENYGVIKSLSEINAIGHRVVHGAEKYCKAALIDATVMEDIKGNIPLAPLHMPANLLGVEACMEVMPGVPNVAVFDTAFHQTMPEEAYMYATPYQWYQDYRVRKYGFHGTSHEFISREIALAMGKKVEDLKIISCHIGNGASMCAIKNGKCIDTSMGFTPLEGLVMGTRSGDIDPAVIEYVMNNTGLNISEILNVLNKKSGLLGVSGISNDVRDVIKEANAGNKHAQLAIKIYVHKIRLYIGAYSASMGGVDAIAFSAGTGENRDDIREQVMKDFEYLGVDFDFEANKNFKRGVDFCISKPNSKVQVWIIPTDEELSIARQTKQILGA